MDLEQINYRGFKPREEVERDMRRVAQKILDESPIGGHARLVITEKADQFHFSVVGTSKNKFFNSEATHRKKDLKGWPRTWQLGAVAELLSDFIKQVRSSFTTSPD